MVPRAISAATTERILTDRYTGLALGGYDPVAYFTAGRPLPGLADVEARADGVVWRFHNEGNRAAFLAHPQVYQPRFGGHDPVGVAEGRAAAGSVQLWLVWRDRLYLFSRDDTREVFSRNPARFLGEADRRWPEVRRLLAE